METIFIRFGVAAALCLHALTASAQETAASVVVQFDDLPVQLDITDLKRTDDGSTLMLRGVVKNSTGQAFNMGYTKEMSLIDFKNRRKYMVIHDSSLDCICSPALSVDVSPGGTTHVWAKFPAPPESVTTLSFGWGKAQPVSLQITK